MTPFQWFLMCILFTLYLLLGGSVFMYFEQHREIERKEEISVLRKDIKEILILLDREFYRNDTTVDVIHALANAKLDVIKRISSVCGDEDLVPPNVEPPSGSASTTTTTEKPKEDDESDDKDAPLKWNFYNSFFFAFTVITTIGYGHLSPSTSWSKGFVMIYALIGIPINSILLSGLGDYFASKLVKVHKKSKKSSSNCAVMACMAQICFYLIPGLIVFIIIPAGVFVVIEDWTFLDAVYYAFISLTTIGFGDYVAGMGSGHTAWMWVYKSSIIIWITFGLGYLIMILGFISKGMTHKRVRVVIEKPLNTIRVTKERLTRDIEYMRRVVNELYFLKVKPVYEVKTTEVIVTDYDDGINNNNKDQSNHHHQFRRRRHNSIPSRKVGRGLLNLNVDLSPGHEARIQRRWSESDLRFIDKAKTFQNASRVQVTIDELLFTVVEALQSEVEERPGYHPHPLDPSKRRQSQAGLLIRDDGDASSHEPTLGEVSFHIGDTEDTGGHNFNSHWELDVLSESDEDEEEELRDADTDVLRKVVVVPDHSVKRSPSFLGTVSDAIRKISTGSRTSLDGASRKTFRHPHEPFRKSSRNNEMVGPGPPHSPRPYLNPQAYVSRLQPPPRRKISSDSSKSNWTNFSSPSPGALRHKFGADGSSASDSDRTSHNTEGRRTPTTEERSGPNQRMSLDSTSLAEFLTALDNVHRKVTPKISVCSYDGDNSYYVDQDESLPRHPGGPVISSRGNGPEEDRRRRKMGVVHSDSNLFAYENKSFVSSNGEISSSSPETNKDKATILPIKKDFSVKISKPQGP